MGFMWLLILLPLISSGSNCINFHGLCINFNTSDKTRIVILAEINSKSNEKKSIMPFKAS